MQDLEPVLGDAPWRGQGVQYDIQTLIRLGQRHVDRAANRLQDQAPRRLWRHTSLSRPSHRLVQQRIDPAIEGRDRAGRGEAGFVGQDVDLAQESEQRPRWKYRDA